MRRFYVMVVGALLASAIISASAASESYVQSIRPFNRALARICFAKHLKNLNPGGLDLVINDYLDTLSLLERRKMERAAQPMCVESIAGVSCSNIAYIRAARKLHLTDKLAKAACQSGYVCRALYDCVKLGN